MDATHLIPEKGTLDVSEIINSDYAFAWNLQVYEIPQG